MRSLIILIWLLLLDLTVAQEWRECFALESISENNVVILEPGDSAEFLLSSGRAPKAVKTSEGIVELSGVHTIIPRGSDFSPSRVYVWLIGHPLDYDRRLVDTFAGRVRLCEAMVMLYPDHELSEALLALACEYQYKSESLSTMGKSRYEATIKLIDVYLNFAPRGLNADRLAYLRFCLSNNVYEYEGSIKLVLEHIELYQNYLVEHPTSKVIEDVKFDLARLYRMAFECFHPDQHDEKRWVKSKAVKLYSELSTSENVEHRHRARVALFNLAESRRCYSAPNDW